MTPTDKVLGQIAAMNTFIENFPISILDMMHGKVYTSIFDFMIDVLCACGVDVNEVIDYLLREIYGIEANINGSIEGFYESIRNGSVDIDEQNEFLEGLENAIKGIFMGLLSSIFTCSAIPVLPNKVFDGPNSDTFEGNESRAFKHLQKNSFEPFLVPASVIDPMGLLDINPTSNDGRLFYAIEGRDRYYHKEFVVDTTEEGGTFKYVEIYADEDDIPYDAVQRVNIVKEENILLEDPEYIVHYDGLNPNTLYKTYDMNAFLWYALHKGMKTPQIEYNHMMWDSRVSAIKQGVSRKSSKEWNDWYNSKSGYTDEFKYVGSAITETSPIYPIIQLEPQGMSENLFRIHIPSQRYFFPKIRNANIDSGTTEPSLAFNASIYKYNWDYLTNIRILQPKILLVGLCEYLLGFSLSTIASTNINLTKKIIEAKLSKAIKSIIEANDMEVEDCYMEFSNDEVNAMMEEMLLSRYNATTYGGETATVRVHDTKKYIAMLDQINANASSEGNITSLTRLITEVTADPGTEGSIDYGIQVSTDGNLLKKLLWAIVMPILLSIFTPQVLLLLYINFELMGITNVNDFMGQDFSKILNLLMNKIFGLLKSIILFIKDKIVELLLTLFYEKILPLLLKYETIILLERITYWLEILKAALNCLPRFKFNRNKVIGAIDYVDYADITNNQNTPESTANC